MAKLRNQLTLSNNQLTECDRLNCKLREDLDQAKVISLKTFINSIKNSNFKRFQELIQNQISTIQSSKVKEEQNEDQFNQTLAEKDTQILELQDKLDGLIQPRMNSARSREELEAIDSNEGGLVAVTKQLKKIVSLLMVLI